MKRKKQLFEEFKIVEKEMKILTSIVQEDDYLPSEDEIHGWVLKMDVCINRLEELKKEILDFYRN